MPEQIEWPFPLSLLNTDLLAFMEWQQEVGLEESEAQINAASKNVMNRYGHMAALDISELLDRRLQQMENTRAVAQEFTV